MSRAPRSLDWIVVTGEGGFAVLKSMTIGIGTLYAEESCAGRCKRPTITRAPPIRKNQKELEPSGEGRPRLPLGLTAMRWEAGGLHCLSLWVG